MAIFTGNTSVYSGGAEGVGFTSRPYSQPLRSFPTISPTASAPAPSPPITVGIEPQVYEAVLFGKTRPVFVGGIALMGGRIIEGPFYGGAPGEPTVSALYEFAEAANPGGTRSITEVRLRGALAAIDGSGFFTDPAFAGARIQFRTGTRTQLPFDVSVGRYGANAIAYRNRIVASLTDMPLRPFNGIIPFISIKIEDSTFGDPLDGITHNDALSVLLRRSRLADSEFEVDVQGSCNGMIVANKSNLVEFLQMFRQIHVNWNITYTDKLRIIEPSDFTVGVEITRDNHARSSMSFTKTDPLIIPRKKNLTYIDKDRDYEPNVVSGQEDPFPWPSTSSIDEENTELPVISTAAQETAEVNVSLYEELAVRSQMGAVLDATLFTTEAGDAVRFADHDDINFVGRVMETQHDFSTWQVTITAGEVLNCGADVVEPELPWLQVAELSSDLVGDGAVNCGVFDGALYFYGYDQGFTQTFLGQITLDDWTDDFQTLTAATVDLSDVDASIGFIRDFTSRGSNLIAYGSNQTDDKPLFLTITAFNAGSMTLDTEATYETQANATLAPTGQYAYAGGYQYAARFDLDALPGAVLVDLEAIDLSYDNRSDAVLCGTKLVLGPRTVGDKIVIVDTASFSALGVSEFDLTTIADYDNSFGAPYYFDQQNAADSTYVYFMYRGLDGNPKLLRLKVSDSSHSTLDLAQFYTGGFDEGEDTPVTSWTDGAGTVYIMSMGGGVVRLLKVNSDFATGADINLTDLVPELAGDEPTGLDFLKLVYLDGYLYSVADAWRTGFSEGYTLAFRVRVTDIPW